MSGDWGAVDPLARARSDAGAAPTGGRVERTGIALVRRGEVVVPVGDGLADVTDAVAPPRVTLEFSVAIDIGPSADAVAEAAADLALRRLRAAIDARPAP